MEIVRRNVAWAAGGGLIAVPFLDIAAVTSVQLKMIKELIDTHCTTEEEICPDVADSEKALVEAIEKLYVEELVTREPEGDA